jgi:beta-glucosidase
MTVSFTVSNDGPIAGAEVPQVYLGVNCCGEPPRRLAGWQKVYLHPGEARQVSLTIPDRMQSVWDTARNAWEFVPGNAVYVGASSRDIRLQRR